MDRDQKKFYDDAEVPQDEVVKREIKEGPVDDMKYFLGLLSAIRDTITEAKNLPLSSKKIVDADRCLDILDEIDNNLPDAIQYGLQMYSERQRILGNAENAAITQVASAEMRARTATENAKAEAQRIRNDAENEANAIIEDARMRAEKMVDDSEIMQMAREEARKLRGEAKIEASETKLKCVHDMYELVKGVEDELTDSLNSVRRKRSELEKQQD